MQEFIAREKIKRFGAQLAACADESQRVTLERLLASERQRLQMMTREGQTRPEAKD